MENLETIQDPAQLPLFLTERERRDETRILYGLPPLTDHGQRLKAAQTPATHTRVYAHLPSRHLNAHD